MKNVIIFIREITVKLKVEKYSLRVFIIKFWKKYNFILKN